MSMDLRHLRYFIAVAEEGSLTVAAEKRLHTAQPSLSRQMRDLEEELGCALMIRGAKGIVLTPAGRVFLDHARSILVQVEGAAEATRRAATPAKASFVLGFLTGHEIQWLAGVMAIIRHELPNTEVVLLSLSSPDLADGLMRGKIDLAFLRHEQRSCRPLTCRDRCEPPHSSPSALSSCPGTCGTCSSRISHDLRIRCEYTTIPSNKIAYTPLNSIALFDEAIVR